MRNAKTVKFRVLNLGDRFRVGVLTFQKLTENTATHIRLASGEVPVLQTAHMFRPETEVEQLESEHPG